MAKLMVKKHLMCGGEIRRHSDADRQGVRKAMMKGKPIAEFLDRRIVVWG